MTKYRDACIRSYAPRVRLLMWLQTRNVEFESYGTRRRIYQRREGMLKTVKVVEYPNLDYVTLRNVTDEQIRELQEKRLGRVLEGYPTPHTEERVRIF